MLDQIGEQLRIGLGLGIDVSNVDAVQMALRTIVIYAVTLVLVRLGSKRFLSDATAFDVIVSIMLGSIMSRAINGSAPFVPTLVAGAILLGLHWLLAFLAFRTNWFGSLVKGDPVLLIKDGEIQPEGMRRSTLTENDLMQSLRLQLNESDLSAVKRAYLERNGRISLVPYEREPVILHVDVEDCVQTVRIELSRSGRETPSQDERGGLKHE